jgi:mannose-1-phosphate guanylyltransferase
MSEWCGVILAGGEGKRLNPLTAHICKPMVPVTNNPMIDYAIDHLRYAGIKKIIVVVKHLGDELRALIQQHWPMELCQSLGIEVLVPKVNSEGTADAVRKVVDTIQSKHFVVSMADIVTNLPMKEFMAYHERTQAQATVSMKRIEEMATKYGNTILDDKGRILRFLEKPSSEEIYLSALTGGSFEYLPIINTGIYCFKYEMLNVILENPNLMDFGMDVFPFLLENRYRLYGFVGNYYWLDVGNPTTYLWSNWDMLRLYGYPISPLGVRQGNEHVWYYDNARPKSVTHGPYVCIGSQNTFGTGCVIKELSSIGSSCTFGNAVMINRSVIWDRVKVGNNVQIEQSVIANDCEIGDGCILRSNTIIGPKSVIPPQTTLDSKTIPANTRFARKSA